MAWRVFLQIFVIVGFLVPMEALEGMAQTRRERARDTIRRSQRPGVRPQPQRPERSSSEPRETERSHLRPQPRPVPRPAQPSRPGIQPSPRPRPSTPPRQLSPPDHDSRPSRRVHPSARPRYRPRYYPRYHAHLHPHYHAYPWFGRVVISLPPAYFTFPLGGHLYYYYGGFYYRTHPGGYVVVQAPLGAPLAALPDGFISLSVGSRAYYYYYGTFYIYDDARGAYVVVPAPVGAIVPTLPAGYAIVSFAGDKYYVLGDVYYRPLYRDRALMYQVVAPPGNPQASVPDNAPEFLQTFPHAGQTPAQEVQDRAACYHWAVDASGFDPLTAAAEPQARQQGFREYNRAFRACMQAQDYTVQ